MDIPPSYMALMNCAIIIKRVKGQDGKSTRRAIVIQELKTADNYHAAFKWEPKTDYFNPQLHDSEMLARIGDQTGLSIDEVLEEFEKRKLVLKWLSQRGVRSYDKVAEEIGRYYRDPGAMIKKIESGV